MCHGRYPELDALCEAGQPLTYDAALDALNADTGDAPGSRYGTYHRQWAPVAAAVAVVLSRETGDPGCYCVTVEHVASLVVNDHDDPAYLLVNYGPENGIDPDDYLDPEVIAAVHATYNRRGVCDNCGTPGPGTALPSGRFCDEVCADAYVLG